jgi:hypothetical protein
VNVKNVLGVVTEVADDHYKTGTKNVLCSVTQITPCTEN